METRLFVPPGHYYSPIVNPAELRQRPPVQTDPRDTIAIDDLQMLALWESFRPFLEECLFPTTQEPGSRFYFENPFYSYADAGVFYAMLRKYRPRRLIEIGSGFSSALVLDTAEQFLPNLEITFIDPCPDDRLNNLLRPGDHARICIIKEPVQAVDLALFETLEAGDLLFIDSTHVVKTGSDVCHEIFNILPRLRSGVLIHFHDISYPFQYPTAWIYDENRSWNEIYIMRAFLMHSTAYRVVFFNGYFHAFHRDAIEGAWPPF